MVERNKRRTILVIEGEVEVGRQDQIIHRLNKDTVAYNKTFPKVGVLFNFPFRAVK